MTSTEQLELLVIHNNSTIVREIGKAHIVAQLQLGPAADYTTMQRGRLTLGFRSGLWNGYIISRDCRRTVGSFLLWSAVDAADSSVAKRSTAHFDFADSSIGDGSTGDSSPGGRSLIDCNIRD